MPADIRDVRYSKKLKLGLQEKDKCASWRSEEQGFQLKPQHVILYTKRGSYISRTSQSS